MGVVTKYRDTACQRTDPGDTVRTARYSAAVRLPIGDVAAASSGPALPSMPAEMPPVSFDRRDRADALPTAATAHTAAPQAAVPNVAAQKLSPGEQALVDHVWRHDGDAEVICIVRPRGAAQTPSDVFVLQGTGRDFVQQLSKAKAADASATHSQGTPAASHHAAPSTTRSDVATLPATELTR